MYGFVLGLYRIWLFQVEPIGLYLVGFMNSNLAGSRFVENLFSDHSIYGDSNGGWKQLTVQQSL